MIPTNLDQLRDFLANAKVDAFIIPTSDPHKSEYIEPYNKTRQWLTGFTGSAGTAVVTNNHAGLWTDSRYFSQAEVQLIKPFVLHKMVTRQPEYIDWLIENLKPGQVIGYDAVQFSMAELTGLKLKTAIKGLILADCGDIFSTLWKNRPALSKNQIFNHPSRFNALSRVQKIALITQYLAANTYDIIVFSALDEIAWLLNLRGNDIAFNPVFTAFFVVNKTECVLFIDNDKVPHDILFQLSDDNIIVKDYTLLTAYLLQQNEMSKIVLDFNTINAKIGSALSDTFKLINEKSIVTDLKAIKQPAEIDHYKHAQTRDGVAMCQFLHWLEATVKTNSITEIDAAIKCEWFRSQQENYIGLSFDVISAYQANAAMPHYTTQADKPVLLNPKGLYLVDSGAQYLDGTTDITRTIALGRISQQQKIDFTLVLKGHIRLASAKFPKGTRGFHLDTLARLDLWQHGKDYGHGTGHGIGYFLNVHEGPQGFAQATTGNANTIFEPGMLITNEPGYYEEGNYGIRTENVMVCVDSETPGFLQFETVTYCPIDTRLMEISLLEPSEIEWINTYHQKVYSQLAPYLDEPTRHWLKENTSTISK